MGCDDWKEYDRLDVERAEHNAERAKKPKCLVPIEPNFIDKESRFIREPVLRALAHAYGLTEIFTDKIIGFDRSNNDLNEFYEHLLSSRPEDQQEAQYALETYSLPHKLSHMNQSDSYWKRQDPGYMSRKEEERVDEEDEVDRSRIRKSITSIALSGVALMKPIQHNLEIASFMDDFTVQHKDILWRNAEEVRPVFFEKVLAKRLRVQLAPNVYGSIKHVINPLNDLVRSPRHETYGEFTI